MEQKKVARDSRPEPRELNSWTEIAHHLGVNVRTAQKWERERRLPVPPSFRPRSRVSADIARRPNDSASSGAFLTSLRPALPLPELP